MLFLMGAALLQLWRQPQNAVTPTHRARLHSHYNLQPSPAPILPEWDLSWIPVSMQCTTQQQHTHAHLHRTRHWKWGNSQVVSHRTQWMCGHKTLNSLLLLERICNDHLVLLPPPHFRADQQLKHLKCISQILKRWQAWGTDQLSQQPVPVLDCQTGLKLIWNYSSRKYNETTKLT